AALERGEAEQARVIAEPARGPRLGDGLPRRPGEAGDHGQRPVGPGRSRFGGEPEDFPVEARLADGELGGVDADGEPARAGVEIIARQRALAAHIEFPAGVERQRMRGDDRPGLEQREGRRLPVAGGVRRFSHYPNSGPATANRRRGSPKGCARWWAMRVKLRWMEKPC